MIIYIDMDDTLVNFTKARLEALRNNPNQPYPQSQYGFFANLEPIEDAVWAYNTLCEEHYVYFLTAPSVKNPLCYTEKRISIEKLFGYDACSKLIIADDKSLFKGDILIDDRANSNNQDKFEGMFIHFGSKEYPNWKTIVKLIQTHKTWACSDDDLNGR